VEKIQMKKLFLVGVTAMCLGSLFSNDALGAEVKQEQVRRFVMRPIGHVNKDDGKTTIVLQKEFQPGLLGLEGFSHIYVYWWFDRMFSYGRATPNTAPASSISLVETCPLAIEGGLQ
jgi:hypothetical protein